MRRVDIERLTAPYPDASPDPSASPLRVALGVDVPKWSRLAQDVLSDFSDEEYGVTWWAVSLDVRRRILISDYLLQVLQATRDNLTEAKLHFLEWQHATETQSARLDASSKAAGRVQHAASNAPMDDIHAHLVGLHEAGVARAIGSVFDCLAATLVIVSAAPIPIMSDATYTKTVKTLKDRQSSTKAGATKVFEAQALSALLSSIETAAPAGWLEWALDLRNMYVHRGRRMQMNEVSVRSHLLDSKAKPIPRVDVIRRLPKSPDRSEVETLRDFSATVPLLPEDAQLSMQELISATRFVVDEVGDALHRLWSNRRLLGTGGLQPAQQWPLDRTLRGTFNGFLGGRKFDPANFQVNGQFVRRLRSAALFDETRDTVWK